MTRTRVNLLFGFLGSGKTTLAARILKEFGPERRLAMIVNEFGDVGVDGDVLQGNSIDLIQLASGCLCCTLKGSLHAAVIELSAGNGLDHIVIEATGVAEPEELLNSFADPAFGEPYEIGPVVTVVDTPKFLKIREMLGPFYEAQAEKADYVILNKLDLADMALAEEVREEVEALNPEAIIRYAERCDIDLEEVLDGPESAVFGRYLAADKPPQEPARREGHDHSHTHGGGAHDHAHHEGARHAPAESFVVDLDRPLDRTALERLYKDAPEGLWRSKGFVQMRDGSALVQVAMGQLELTPTAERDRHYLVFIGDGLDRAWFEDRLISACLERTG